MIQFTKDDNCRFGWNGAWFNGPETGPNGKADFKVQFNRCARDPEPWREECVRAAKEIERRAQGNKLVLACSNGWDSEVMFRSFVLAGVPFEVAVVEMEQGLNWHDISHVAVLCREFGIPMQTHRMNLLAFIEEDLPRLTEEHKLTMPAMAMQLWLLDRMEGMPVFGSGDLHMRRLPYTERVFVEFAPHRTVLARHLSKSGREGFPFFFMETPELMLAYLEHPLTRVFLRTSFCMRIGSFLRFRHPTYAYSFPELGSQRLNANGWELVRPHYERVKRGLEKKYSALNPTYKISYWDLVRMLSRDPVAIPESASDPAIEPCQLDPDLWPQKDGEGDFVPLIRV